MNRARWTVQHHQRVLATDPITYWILDEKQGAIAYDRVSGRALGAQNGAHVGVTLGQPGIGDGRTSPLYDGVLDYTNVFSAAFAAAFNGSEGTVALWARVANAGVWTDGIRRRCFHFSVDGNNFVLVRRDVVNGQLVWTYASGGAIKVVALVSPSPLDWMHIAITWDINAGVNGEMRAYYNGAQTGGTQVALGAWVGAIAAAVVGAHTVAPIFAWSGYLGSCAVWNRALPPAEIADLAVVE